MERKLIKQGGGGYTIYLPKTWVDRKGLHSGDKVNLIEKESSLVIQSEALKNKEFHLFLNKGNENNLSPLITHLYRQGYNKIIIESLNKDSHIEIKKIQEKLLLGFEITKKEKSSCTLENISEPSNQKYNVMIDKLFFLINEALSLLLEDSQLNKWQNMQDIQEIKDQHDKFSLFCKRIIVKESEQNNLILNWEFLTFLTHIIHNIYYLYSHLNKTKSKISSKTIDLLKSCKKYFILFEESYKTKNIDAINKINLDKKEYHFGSCLKQLSLSKGNETIALSYIRELFRLIQIGTSPIISLIIDEKTTSV